MLQASSPSNCTPARGEWQGQASARSLPGQQRWLAEQASTACNYRRQVSSDTRKKYSQEKHFQGHAWPKMKLSGRKICPKGPERTESIVPGSRSISTARGT